ncbi:MAG TPA: ABC transporter permease, partial [Thermoanaerobaculia bacterium]|nr:ABC transporter permease [Thermoanaerobaculia bacterium]
TLMLGGATLGIAQLAVPLVEPGILASLMVLGLVAAGLGLALAYLGRSALWAMRPPFLQGTVLDLSFDGRVLGFTLVLAVVTSVLFGLLPALQTTRAGVVSELKDGGGVSGERFRFLSRRNLLVAGQVALALVALSGASLLMASLRRAMAIDPGFNVQQTGVMAFDVGALGLDRGRGEQFYDAVLERARATPGVTSAALVTDIPLTFGGFLRTVFAEGHDPKAENNGLLTAVDPIGDGYFKTIGIELLRGRDFSSLDREDGAYVAIFNETAAKRFWPGEEALGKRFRFFGEKWILEVVGIAKDSKYNNVGEDPVPHIYLPRWQHYGPALGLVLRCQGKPEVALATVRNEVRKLEPNMPVANVQPMAAVVRQSLWAPRMGAWLLGILGGMAMVLALVGIYGVMSYSVEQRKREIGI